MQGEAATLAAKRHVLDRRPGKDRPPARLCFPQTIKPLIGNMRRAGKA